MSILKCIILLLLIIVGLPAREAHAQAIDFQFHVYKLDVKTADALQARLIAGGDTAVQVAARLPDFVKQQRVSLEAELSFQVQAGQRAKEASSERMLEVNERFREVNEIWEVADGLELEIDARPDTTGSIIDIDMFARFSDRSKEGVKVRELTASLSVLAGVPFLVSRWQEGEEVLMFVGTALASSSSAPGIVGEGRQMIYLDGAFYSSAANAKAGREQLGRIVVPARQGTRAKSEIYVVLIYDVADVRDSRNLGFKIESNAKVEQSGVIDSAVILEYARKTGKRDRLPDGTRVPEIEIRRARVSLHLKDGESKTVDAEISSLGNPAAKTDTWKMTVLCRLREIR